jgi:DNA-binding NtrC family response regulator
MQSVNPKTKVLVVDDEPAIRHLVGSILQSNGYNVLDADSASSAMSIMSGDKSVELLITDVVMPNLTGNELVERVSRDLPDLRVLFMSGYGVPNVDLGAGNRSGFIRKPFSISDLLAEVERVLA